MQRRSITWRVLAFNLLIVLVLAGVTAGVFRLIARRYMEQNVVEQLSRIAQRAETITVRSPGPALLWPGLPPELEGLSLYFELERAFRETLTVLNADYILLDQKAEPVIVLPSDWLGEESNVRAEIAAALDLPQGSEPRYVSVNVGGEEYAVVVKQLARANPRGVRWLVIYSSLEMLNDMEAAAFKILVVILLAAVLLSMLVSVLLVRRITAPFAVLTQHIRAIAQRDFGRKVDFPVDAELKELVESINTMSEKLETHDEAQKTFLQNVSHEFRTPLMAIGSYAEGLLHNVVEPEAAAGVIVDETKRLAKMVEDLLYLSRLQSIEEHYQLNLTPLRDILADAIQTAQGLAAAKQKQLAAVPPDASVTVLADGEKLARAVVNVLDNCLRYAQSEVTLCCRGEGRQVQLVISDDGPGIREQDLPNIFKRFFKGPGGHAGLGLAIAASIVESHGGTISARNTGRGAEFTITLPQAGSWAGLGAATGGKR